MPKALIPLANGVEEMEAVITMDTLRRAGWTVISAGIGRRSITASRGVNVVADTEWNGLDLASFDALVVPGGAEGTKALMADATVLDAIRDFAAKGRLVAAICAGPLVLQAAGILNGRRVTCHPAVKDQISGATRLDDRVVVDGRIVTSQGPGTTFEFALTLISLLSGEETANKVRVGLVL